jgi:uncharacterized protein involved in exopolysaccharide biosynthesis
MESEEFSRLTKPHKHRPDTEDIDVATLGRALWRAKGWILGLAIGAGIITFIGLSMVRPLFTSEARILMQNDESSFTRPAADQGREQQVVALDEQAVQSQVQVLTSRDLAVEVIKALDLTNSPEFAKDAGVGPIKRFLNRLGLGRGSPKSEEEKAANAFAEHLSVFPLAKSSVIAVEYISGDSPLAAKIANKLADVYIGWQREAKLEQTKDATAWLSAQIEVLRKKVAESEAAAEQFRASQGLFAGTNNVTLNAQQLSELNSQVILAKAQKSEAEARARLIKKMLADKGDIDATPEVLKSEVIGRLIDQRVQVQRQLAELSATLMPSHPRIKQLTAELADVRTQILDEATKIVKGLENEAEVASARESSLRSSLNDVKTQASGLSEAEINLRALEREAKANRDLLESYLARYRDASARHDMGAVPAQAAIVSRAHASVLPSFPKRGPLTLLVAAATALLALAYVLARELIGAPAERREPLRADEPRVRERRVAPPQPAAASAKPFAPAEQVRSAPAAPPKAPAAAISTPKVEPAMVAITKAVPAAFFTPKAEPVSPPKAGPISPPIVEPAVASTPKAEPVATPKAEPVVPSAPKPEAAVASAAPMAPMAPTQAPLAASAQASGAVATAPATQPKVEPPRPAWPRAEAGQSAGAQAATGSPEPAKPNPSAGELSAAAGLLDRLRRGLSLGPSETPAADPQPAAGLFNRLRRALPTGQGEGAKQPNKAAGSTPPKAGETASLRPNELRHYLNQRIAAAASEPANDSVRNGPPPAPNAGSSKLGPVLKSLDAVLNHILASGKGSAPRAVLVAGVSAKVDATPEAIQIARSLVARREQAVLVDLTCGATAVSGPLGLPRAPGFTDLAAGRAGFEDVVRIDDDTPLQVITTGNPKVMAKGEATDRFTRVFEALTQAYDCVVLHADREAVRRLTPALKFELPVVVAVLPAGAGAKSAAEELRDFSALGCPVLLYEQSGKEPRSGFLNRVAAI